LPASKQRREDGAVTFGKKSADPCRRLCEREEVMLAASALAVTRSRSVVVSDLSTAGARLAGRDLPAPGDDLFMIVGSLDEMARVVWRAGDKCGISFDEPLGDGNIAQMKREAGWASVTGWER
jgi:hypothetical protein